MMQPVLKAFEAAHPEIKIEASYAPPVQGYITTLQARLLAGTAPDVFMMAAENKTGLIDGKFVLDLAGEGFMSNIPKFNQTTYGRDGSVYGMSIASWGAGLMYNVDMLASVGYDAPPENWDDFIAMCLKLDAAGISPFLEAIDGMPIILGAQLGAYNASIGGTMDDKIFDGTSSFDEQWTPIVKEYNKLYESGAVTRDVVGLSRADAQNAFYAGKTAMTIGRPWIMAAAHEAGGPDLKFKVVKVPAIAGFEPYVAGAASPAFAINSSSDKVEAAKTFLTWMSSPAGAESFATNTGQITVTSDFKPTLDPALDPILSDIRAGNLYLPQIAWQRSEDVLNQEAIAQIQRMVTGEITPQEFTKALDSRLASAS
ncbi:ABC-type glycerol-3-phosphate transport system substrate-binding protein [Demequina lutea]|uniref:ABC-type glycerol-3-phosphate transport system substrate-binding protein n=2 Tax=Demequina lutea TaxID=431489 RepID=A0A7Y9ZDF2_9MICO|nr:ABC-type glycerol-3-phosphate transport system substrate-binding protein [Demequina lutea]